MFGQLIASQRNRFSAWFQSGVSLFLHVALILVAVEAPAGQADTGVAAVPETALVFLRPPEPTVAPSPSVAARPAVVRAAPPDGFRTVVPPDAVPTAILPPDLTEPFDPGRFIGRGPEAGHTNRPAGAGGTEALSDEEYREAEVDDPVALLSAPRPRYPAVMLWAGTPGRVEVQYVVDTTGRAEPSSWIVLASSNLAFEAPAREAIMGAVFKPARFRGRAVRQLVRQTISFALER